MSPNDGDTDDDETSMLIPSFADLHLRRGFSTMISGDGWLAFLIVPSLAESSSENEICFTYLECSARLIIEGSRFKPRWAGNLVFGNLSYQAYNVVDDLMWQRWVTV